MILTDDEIEQLWIYIIERDDQAINFGRAIEAAILKKIGEPVAWVLKSDIDRAEHFLKVRFVKPEHDQWYELYKLPEVTK